MKIRKQVVVALLAIVAVSFLIACSKSSPPNTPTPGDVVSTRPQGVPPNISHTLLGRTQCTLCHTAGISQVPAKPADHVNITSDRLCTVCHKPLDVTTVAAPPIPHTLQGRSQCLVCHSTGLASAPVAPSEMAALSNDECTLCHGPVGQGQIGTPVPGGTPVVKPQPPNIPHTLEGRTDCLQCHGTLVQLPEDHAGRPVEICTVCHQPGHATVPTPMPTPGPSATGTPSATATPGAGRTPPNIPHTLEGRSDCLLCHSSTLPQSHVGRTSETCTLCHQPGVVATPTATPKPTATPSPTATATPVPTVAPGEPTPTPAPTSTPTATPTVTPVPTPTAASQEPPKIPHTLEGRSNCTTCHNGTIAPFPANHAGRTNETCLLCHKQ